MAEAGRGARVLVVGVGNDLRGDDGAGLEVARRVRRLDVGPHVEVLEEEGEPLELLERLAGARAVLLVDAVRSDAPAGSIVRLDLSGAPMEGPLRTSASTHLVTLAEAIELARVLGRLPQTVLLYGIEAASVQAGSGLSPAVQAAVAGLAATVAEEARRLAR